MAPNPRKVKKDDLGAGLRVSKQNIEEHPAGPPRYGELSQAERAFTLASTFLSGVLAISASQFLGAPLKLIDPAFYDGYMAYTKECFAVLVTCLTQWWAPTVVRVSGDSTMLGQMKRRKDGSLHCTFSDRMVLMANHQLYTDWLYLWWIAYTNGMHGFVYIILKESLKSIPIIGWGAQFYNFIFLARNWEEDQRTFKKHLSVLNKPDIPMWLIIFPEGTNLSGVTREKSRLWAEKNGLKDMKHQLLPRSTGLRFCLQELRQTTEWLYDCTIAYEGVPPGQFGQDIFTLRSSFFEGRPPKSVNMHWRRFFIDDIPFQNTKGFEVWLRNRWREKDYMLEYFSRHGRFPAENFWKHQLDQAGQSSNGQSIRSMARPAVNIETEVKSGSWNEFVKIFAPITSVFMALSVAYGISPGDMVPGGQEFLNQHLKTLLQGGDLKGLPSPEQLERMLGGVAGFGAGQHTKPGKAGEVQQLTQENLAKLVKETAIKSGAVMPGGLRRASTALPGAPTKTMVTPSAQVKKQVKSTLRSPLILKPVTQHDQGNAMTTNSKQAPTISKPQVSKPRKSKPTPDSQGKVNQSSHNESVAQKTITTKDGLRIRIGKKTDSSQRRVQV